MKRLYDAFHEPFRRAKPVRIDALLGAGASSSGSPEVRALAAVGTESASAVKAAARGPVVATIRATQAMPESEGQDSEGGDDGLLGDQTDLIDSYEDDDEVQEDIETDLAEFLEAPPVRLKRQKLASRKKEIGLEATEGSKRRRASSLAEVGGQKPDDAGGKADGNGEERIGSAYKNEVEVI